MVVRFTEPVHKNAGPVSAGIGKVGTSLSMASTHFDRDTTRIVKSDQSYSSLVVSQINMFRKVYFEGTVAHRTADALVLHAPDFTGTGASGPERPRRWRVPSGIDPAGLKISSSWRGVSAPNRTPRQGTPH